jgi:hypothetical protein
MNLSLGIDWLGRQDSNLRMPVPKTAQRCLAVVDLTVEEVDQPQRGDHVGGPRLGQRQAVQ